MKILHPDQLRKLDVYTIENEPVHSINLMERAAKVCAEWIDKNIEIEGEVKIFAGPGNNGGDGLAIARMLADKGYTVSVFTIGKLSDDAIINYNRLIDQNKTKAFTITSHETFPIINENELIVDALFGYGLSRPLDGLPAQLVTYINQSKAKIVAIDIPSGLFAEDNSSQKLGDKDTNGDYTYENVIRANYTLTLELPFLSFFFANIDPHVGEWFVLPINLHKGFLKGLETNNYYLTTDYIKNRIKRRKKFSHKGNYGHALLIAGGLGKTGAAIMAAKACLRTGIGLITTHIPKCGYSPLHAALPESMISADSDQNFFSEVPDLENYNVIGIGPGIGTNEKTAKALKELLGKADIPMVFDADAINILGKNRDWIKNVPEGSIFTPHPKELERLIGKSDNYYHRNEQQLEFARKYNVYVILKGAHTSITCPDGIFYYNSTGNPGMATGGTGDVLTGIILSLLAQGYESRDAARIGVFIHGLAGDIAAEKYTQQSMMAHDIIKNLGEAFKVISNYKI